MAHASHSLGNELESTEDNFKLTTQDGEDDVAAWAEKLQLVRQRGWCEGIETIHCYLIPEGLCAFFLMQYEYHILTDAVTNRKIVPKVILLQY